MADDKYRLEDILWEYSDFTPPKKPTPLAPQAPELTVSRPAVKAETTPAAKPSPASGNQAADPDATRRFVPIHQQAPAAPQTAVRPPVMSPPPSPAPQAARPPVVSPPPPPPVDTVPAQGGPLVEEIARTVQAAQQTPPQAPPTRPEAEAAPAAPPQETAESPEAPAPAPSAPASPAPEAQGDSQAEATTPPAPEGEAPAEQEEAPAEAVPPAEDAPAAPPKDEGPELLVFSQLEEEAAAQAEKAASEAAQAPAEGEASEDDVDDEEEEENGEPQEVPTSEGPDLLVFTPPTQTEPEEDVPPETGTEAETETPAEETEPERKFTFPWERKAKGPPEPPPDKPPGLLAKEYEHILVGFRPRCILSMILAVLLLVLTFMKATSFFPALNGLIPDSLVLPGGLVLFGVCVVLSLEVLEEGCLHLIHLRPNEDTLALFATLFTVVDTATLMTIDFRAFTMPFLAPCALVLAFHLLGHYCTLSVRYEACKTAATVAQPYMVTKDPNIHGSQSAFRKWIGPPKGFGSQIQNTSQGALRFQRLTIVLLTACLGLGLLTTIAHHQPKLIFWSLSALFTAASTLGAPMMLSLSVKLLSKKLSRLGVALAGWPGIQNSRGCRIATLGDYDLYPPGSVLLSGATPFDPFPMERMISLAASVVRVSASGLAYPFDRLLREQGGAYLPVERLLMQPGGLAGQIGGMQVYVGNSAFMSRLGHTIPSNVKAKDGIFCAVDDQLAGAFTLRYSLHPTILPALRALFAHGLSPLLVTRDFNLTPHRLRLSGQLPANKIGFPDLQRRFILSGPGQSHDDTLVAVLCREGLPPFSDALISTRRIRLAHKFSTILVCVSACIGVFLCATLSSAAATMSLTAWTLSMYLLLWFVPLLLLALWVKQY